ncbi:Sds3-like-domain-containing protein [Trichophaea hybrida]|nr:Sds3-like-domain-containing protein [Trichophaea hybrida]
MTSPSPTPPSLSPTTPHPAHLHHVPQPQSKRDKRRNALSDKLNQLTKSFHNPTNPRTRDQHYRAQITALQVDMQLVTKADISGRDMRLIDDSTESVHKEVEKTLASMGVRGSEAAEGVGGRWYSEFLQKVNDAMEERDTQLTLLNNSHRTKAASLVAQHTRAIIHAREEHKSLANTIQQRLSARLKAQLKKLAAEKESSSTSANALSSLAIGGGLTDIADSNALHLHPSHYGLAAGIGSPRRHGGLPFDDDIEKETSTRRKPRRRAGEVEELMAFGAGMNFDSPNANGKRKRRGAAADVVPDDVSTPPAFPTTFDATSPSANPLDSASAESGEETRRKREEVLKQVYNPVYSLEKLFTEKELLLHSNQATLATLRHFSERLGKDPDQENAVGDDTDDTPTGANTPVPGASVAAGDDEMDIDPEERGRGLSPTREMESLVLGGVPGVGMSYVNKTGIAPPPPGLRADDAEVDLAFLRRSDKRSSAGAVEAASKRQKRT